eukprot:scaffold48336_cov17-Prasinocladus_malaysianus.AAC.1
MPPWNPRCPGCLPRFHDFTRTRTKLRTGRTIYPICQRIVALCVRYREVSEKPGIREPRLWYKPDLGPQTGVAIPNFNQ